MSKENKIKKKSANTVHLAKTGWDIETENKIITLDRYLFDKQESGFTEFESFKEIPLSLSKFPKKCIHSIHNKMLFVILADELLVYTKVK